MNLFKYDISSVGKKQGTITAMSVECHIHIKVRVCVCELNKAPSMSQP